MFTNVISNYNEKNNTWTFRSNFGIGFKSYIENYVMGKKKSDQLFRSISFSEITVDSFFLLELSVIVRMIIDGNTKYSSWVNHKSLKNLLEVILYVAILIMIQQEYGQQIQLQECSEMKVILEH